MVRPASENDFFLFLELLPTPLSHKIVFKELLDKYLTFLSPRDLKLQQFSLI